MIKLRNLVAAALLTLCVASLDASAAQNRAGFNPTHSVTGICWIFLGGRWWQVPC
jgi:hypothetical protein